MNEIHAPLMILGSGPAGYSAAVYAARANLEPVLITGEVFGGQLTTTTDVENWPADHLGVLGSELMERFHAHAERFGTSFVYDHIHTAHLREKPIRLEGNDAVYTCDALIISTGASAMYLGLDTEQEFMGRGVSACATCDGYAHKGKDVVVVGGGSSALEEALYMANIARKVTIVHRRDRFRGEPILVNRVKAKVAEGQMDIIWNAELRVVKGDDVGVNAVEVERNDTGDRIDVPVSGVFISIGHRPNTELFDGQVEMRGGYLVTQGGAAGMATATNIPGVFAAGDVQDQIYRQAVTSAGTGCMAALDAQKYLEETGVLWCPITASAASSALQSCC